MKIKRVIRLIPLAASLLLVACDKPATDERVVTGTVTYRERMSLPPDTVINVSLQDVSRQDVKAVVVAEQETTTDGRQVPIPFELSVDPSAIDERMSYALRATIRSPDGQLLWTTDTMHAALTRGASDSGNELMLKRVQAPPRQEQPPPQTIVYNCVTIDQAFSLTTEHRANELALWLPAEFGGEYLVLAQVPAASGTKYESGGVVFWAKGDEGTLEVSGTRYSGCKRDAHASIWEGAKLSGVDYRAVGNEPGWHLEIRNSDTITLVYDYGDSTVVVPAPEPEVDQVNRSSTYDASTDDHELMVVIKGEPCNDTMSDESFESSVTVTLDGTIFRGCGRALH